MYRIHTKNIILKQGVGVSLALAVQRERKLGGGVDFGEKVTDGLPKSNDYKWHDLHS